MRLFLSSQDLGDYAHVAKKMAGGNNKALFIKNAQDHYPDEQRNFSNPLKQKMFEDAGFEFEYLDLRDYFGKKQELVKKLKTAGSFWSSGGNTFILRRAMKASGFDEIISRMLKNDEIMYGGWSAGSCVLADRLDCVKFGDDSRGIIVPSNYPAEVRDTIWEGLGLIEFIPIPHCETEWFIQDAKRTIEYAERHGLSYKKLNDGQVYIIDGDKQELLA